MREIQTCRSYFAPPCTTVTDGIIRIGSENSTGAGIICVLMSLGDVVVAGVVEERHGGVDGRGQLPGLPRAGVPPAGGTGRVDLKMGGRGSVDFGVLEKWPPLLS